MLADGADDQNSATQQFTLTVESPPIVTGFSKAVLENGTVSFTAGDFTGHFESDDLQDTPATVEITSLPALGQLTLSGTAVSLDQTIPVAQVGNLVYHAPEASADASDSFTWSAGDGLVYAASPASVSISIVAGYEPPVVRGFTKTMTAGDTMIFGSCDFAQNYSDADPTDALQTVKITVLPAHGTLEFSGTAVTAGEEIPATDLVDLTYQAAAGYGGDDFFSWNGSDGLAYAGSDAAVSIAVIIPPSFTPGCDQTAAENGGPQSVAGWATAISAGWSSDSDPALDVPVHRRQPAGVVCGCPGDRPDDRHAELYAGRERHGHGDPSRGARRRQRDGRGCGRLGGGGFRDHRPAAAGGLGLHRGGHGGRGGHSSL